MLFVQTWQRLASQRLLPCLVYIGARQLHPFFPRNYGSSPESNNFEDIMVRKSAKKKDVIKPEKTQK